VPEQPPLDPLDRAVPRQATTPSAYGMSSAPELGQTVLPGGDLVYAGPAEPARRSRLGMVIGALATAIVVTLGVGAYAAVTLNGGGRQPETLVPSTAFAFAKLDLDPAASQKLAVRELADKFPSAPEGEIDEMFDELLREALQDYEDVDFDRDIDPWLGKRIGIAGFLDSSGAPGVLGVIQSADDDKARPALARLAADDPDAAYLLRDGYVLVAADQESLALAVDQLGDGSLADSDEYADDVDALTGDQILTAWVDVARAFDATESQLGEEGQEVFPESLREQLKGRVAMGVHAASDYLEVEAVSSDPGSAGLSGAYPTIIGDLPASTVVAFSANGVGEQLDEALDAFGTLPGAELPSRQEIADEVESAFGLDLDADLLPLLANQVVLALGAVPDFSGEEIPEIALLSLVTDPARAAKTASKIEDLARERGAPLRSQVRGSTFFLATDGGYLGRLTTPQGRLADAPRFRRAVGELDDSVVFVGYADLRELLTLLDDSEEAAEAKALAAVGLRAELRDGRAVFRMRVTVE